MNKNVYLFELDSVRNSAQEVGIAQKALFDELIYNGNTVIMTFNQITDSIAFLCALEDTTTREQIVELFYRGRLKISQFDMGSSVMTTPVQYFIRSLNKCINEKNLEKYYSSSLESFDFTIEDYTILRNALAYCDTTTLLAMADQAKKNNNSKREREWIYAHNWVSLIIDISQSTYALQPPKKGDKYPYTQFIDDVIQYQESRLQPVLKKLGASIEIDTSLLSSLKEETNNKNDRSTWLEVLRNRHLENKETEMVTELIIDLCYNYANEDSISNISKHYKEIGDDTFWNDFGTRLVNYYNHAKNGTHFISSISRDHNWLNEGMEITHWDTLERMLDTDDITDDIEASFIEESYHEDIRKQTAYRRKYFLKQLASLLVFIAIFIGIEYLVNIFQEVFDEFAVTAFGAIIAAIISAGLFAALGGAAEDKAGLPDIRESFKSIRVTLHDMKLTWTPNDNTAYYCKLNQNHEN